MALIFVDSLCVARTVDVQRLYFQLAFNMPMKRQTLELLATCMSQSFSILLLLAAVDCRQYKKPYNNKNIESY